MMLIFVDTEKFMEDHYNKMGATIFQITSRKLMGKIFHAHSTDFRPDEQAILGI